jgi:hypothetical protein
MKALAAATGGVLSPARASVDRDLTSNPAAVKIAGYCLLQQPQSGQQTSRPLASVTLPMHCLASVFVHRACTDDASVQKEE